MLKSFHLGLAGAALLVMDRHLKYLAGVLRGTEKVIEITPRIVAHREMAIIFAEEGLRPTQGVREANTGEPANQHRRACFPRNSAISSSPSPWDKSAVSR